MLSFFPSLRPFFAKYTIITVTNIITSTMMTNATVPTATPTLTTDSAVGSVPDYKKDLHKTISYYTSPTVSILYNYYIVLKINYNPKFFFL